MVDPREDLKSSRPQPPESPAHSPARQFKAMPQDRQHGVRAFIEIMAEAGEQGVTERELEAAIVKKFPDDPYPQVVIIDDAHKDGITNVQFAINFLAQQEPPMIASGPIKGTTARQLGSPTYKLTPEGMAFKVQLETNKYFEGPNMAAGEPVAK